MVRLFLFSGTFFPISKLPGCLQPVAYVTPLWHGVALCRSLALGHVDLGSAAVHVGYLLVLALAGSVAAQRTYTRRLYEYRPRARPGRHHSPRRRRHRRVAAVAA